MKKYKRIIDPVKHFNNWMRNVLRRTFFRWRERTGALHAAKIARNEYKCAICSKIFSHKEIRVDHIDPVVDPKIGFVNWDTYITRLFCKKEDLQILCISCHQIKSNREKDERKLAKTGIFSDAFRLKMSEIRKGHHDNLGIPKSQETKQKMSIMRKGKPQTPARIKALRQTNQKSQIPVIGQNLITGEVKEFASVTIAGKVLGIFSGNVSRVCRNKQGRTQVGGWKFTYKEKQRE